MRPLLAAALLSASPAWAQQPISDIRVVIATAAVSSLECSGRPFEMEWTKTVGRSFKYMGRSMISEGLDPRPLIGGLLAVIIMTPMIALAVPADLAAAPFRRQCSFDFQAQGHLARWAGQASGEQAVAAEGRNALDPGTEGIKAPSYYVSLSSTTTDDQGRFRLSLPGHVGRSSDFDLSWAVKGLPSGRMRLSKSFGRFVLSEPEPEFGATVDTLEPIEIIPTTK
ncbi:MAG TPA: hypothetical protein DCM05_15665 [Elusimicrobia bacterium]|nr:hypothetical protein [Elusimicrobiota bacterium]